MGEGMGNKVDITNSTAEIIKGRETEQGSPENGQDDTNMYLYDLYNKVKDGTETSEKKDVREGTETSEISEKVEETLQQLHDIGKHYDILNPDQKKALTEVMQGMQQDLEGMLKILEGEGEISTEIDVHNKDAMKQTADRIMETLDVNGFNAMLGDIKNAMEKASSHTEISVAVLKFQDEISTIWNQLAHQINHGPYDM